MRKPPPKLPAQGRDREIAAILAATRAVQQGRGLADLAREVLGACAAILGARGGRIVARQRGGESVDVAAYDSGNLEFGARGDLAASFRRLGLRAERTGRAVYSNRLPRTPATGRAADRSEAPRNALLAPILVAGNLAGFLELTDKPGGFSTADARLAEVFAGLTGVAMRVGHAVNGLEKDRHALEKEVRQSATQLLVAEEKFRSLVENLPDVVSRFDSAHRYRYVSPAIRRVSGYSPSEYLGRTNQEMGMSPALAEQWDAALRRVFATGQPERFEFAIALPDDARYFDSRLVAETGPGGAVTSVLSVARDVTERWLAHEAERRARLVAETLREATVVLTRSHDRESVLVTLLDRLRRMVPFDRARVMLVEEASRLSVRAVFDGQRVVPLRAEERPEFEAADHPVVNGILTSGTAVLIPDIRAHPGWNLPAELADEASWMGVPLFARGDVAGLFSLSKREAGYFNEEHVRLAEAMSSQASVAVENAVLFEQMQASTARMQTLSRRLVEAQESERRHIALELHDEAGQALVSLRFGLRLLEREIEEGGSVAGRVADLMQRTDAVIDGLHRLAADLRPASLDHLGLDAALRQYARTVAAKFGLAVHFKARGFGGDRLPAEIETTLYRVVQEAMTNVVRHARATRADLLVEHRGDRVLVVIEDDGVGFEPSQAQRGDHFGLLGLRERAEALGGTLTVESAPGAGATIVVEVPSADPNPDR